MSGRKSGMTLAQQFRVTKPRVSEKASETEHSTPPSRSTTISTPSTAVSDGVGASQALPGTDVDLIMNISCD
jgi:hypothetical protein